MTVTAPTAPVIAGYLAGTWDIDPVHSDVSFTVRHMMVSKVRGSFASFSGTIVTGEDITSSTVTAEIDLASISTNNEQRDAHIRSADFFDTDVNPTMTYRSTAIRADGEEFVVDGELTLHGVTRQVPLRLEVNGIGPDAYGGTRIGFSATTEINRNDFGITWNGAIEAGGVVVSEKVQIGLEVEAVLQVPAA
jgi:polyisoprenoid-binding protein YceI